MFDIQTRRLKYYLFSSNTQHRSNKIIMWNRGTMKRENLWNYRNKSTPPPPKKNQRAYVVINPWYWNVTYLVKKLNTKLVKLLGETSKL